MGLSFVKKSLRVKWLQYNREVLSRYSTGLRCTSDKHGVGVFGTTAPFRSSSRKVSEAIIVVLVPQLVLCERRVTRGDTLALSRCSLGIAWSNEVIMKRTVAARAGRALVAEEDQRLSRCCANQSKSQTE